jgi:hypothetical protein
MQNPTPRYTDESTTDLVVGLVGDARDLALIHLNRMQRELKGELGNLGDVIKARAVSLAGLLVAAVLAGQAIAFGLADAFGAPLWAGFGGTAVVVVIASIIYQKRSSRPSHEIDLVPEVALDAAKQDAAKMLSGDSIKKSPDSSRNVARFTAD